MKKTTIVSITKDEIDVNSVVTSLVLPTTGASVIFTGVVRGETTRGKIRKTKFLEYEAYESMANAKMQQVIDEIRSKWPDVEGVAIIQRTGKIEPGIPTTIIACTAAHRDTGVFEAARYGIDRLKEIVPIWKKETGSKGEEWIEGGYHPGKNE